jgi:hypothetical protein
MGETIVIHPHPQPLALQQRSEQRPTTSTTTMQNKELLLIFPGQ